MPPTVCPNNKGFTLIEVLVASIILTISMLGVLQTITFSMQQNLNNFSRDESVRIAEQRMNELRNSGFTSLANGNSIVTRSFKNFTKNFSVSWTVTALTTNSVAIQVVVSWTIISKTYSHSITSIVSRGV
ncbi:MAG: prepilin-type N-terminal cleavage/methylation domain-containing protein [Proteobacteria bacterium]|nr:prepilin-type N-terminal cleavage/methylation domain-containing protein [Pseudomonadota bacterium]